MAVDDDADNLDLIYPEAGRCDSNRCISAAQALEKLHQSKPHLIVADIAMPQVDGYTLMQRIRELPVEQGKQIPAVVLRAYAGEMNQKLAMAAGLQKYLVKLVDPEQLIEAVIQLVTYFISLFPSLSTTKVIGTYC